VSIPQTTATGVPTIFIVAAEESGDRLGARLVREMRKQLGDQVAFAGTGAHMMAQEGVASLFPVDELSIVGFAAIPQRLPMILRRIREVTNAILAARPDLLVIIDSPDFTQRVAKRVRARDPSIPIVNYVSPSVWAWRPGRARAMSGYVDHLLALLPFEPDVHRKLGGPPCTYVGHPLLEHVAHLRPNADEQQRRGSEPFILAVLPGSRRSEIRRHMDAFGGALKLLRANDVAFEPVIPTLSHLAEMVGEASASWAIQPRIVVGEEAKLATFRTAHLALAKSGTVTLELALSGIPTVAAYKVSAWEAWIIRRLAQVSTVILANLVLGENVVPEFLQEDCTPQKLAAALGDLVGDTAQRRAQLESFVKLDAIMSTGARSPGELAADVALATMRKAKSAAS
jgi:lipid-A-disaccharide synthase